jgi:putative transcriptional regulator
MARKNSGGGFAEGLMEGLQEAIAWKRGELPLEAVNVDPMPPARVKMIRKAVAKSTKEFERRFGIPAATMENWEQGRRKPDPTARALLVVIEREPGAVERALHPE